MGIPLQFYHRSPATHPSPRWLRSLLARPVHDNKKHVARGILKSERRFRPVQDQIAVEEVRPFIQRTSMGLLHTPWSQPA